MEDTKMDEEKKKKLKEAETLVDFLKQLLTSKNMGENWKVIKEIAFWIFIVCSIATNPIFPFTLPVTVYTTLSVAVYISAAIAGISQMDRSKETPNTKIKILDVLRNILSINQKSKKL
jgi:hypothetical protein